jgi:hypothetical protein
VDVGNSVRKAMNDWEDCELDGAMLHACNAVDGTAAKTYSRVTGSNARFTKLLRDNYHILGPMGIPGVDVERTRFPVKVNAPKAPGQGLFKVALRCVIERLGDVQRRVVAGGAVSAPGCCHRV